MAACLTCPRSRTRRPPRSASDSSRSRWTTTSSTPPPASRTGSCSPSSRSRSSSPRWPRTPRAGSVSATRARRSSRRSRDNLPPDIAAQLAPQLEAVLGQTRPGLLTIGALGALWAATGGIGALQKSLNAAYDVKETRNFFAKTGVAVGLTLLGSAGILVAFVTIVGGSLLTQEVVTQLWGSRARRGTPSRSCAGRVMLVLVAFAVAVAPAVRAQRRRSVPLAAGRRLRVRHRLGRRDRRVRRVRRELRQLLEHVRRPRRRHRPDAVVLPDRRAAAARGGADVAAGEGPRARAGIEARRREIGGATGAGGGRRGESGAGEGVVRGPVPRAPDPMRPRRASSLRRRRTPSRCWWSCSA